MNIIYSRLYDFLDFINIIFINFFIHSFGPPTLPEGPMNSALSTHPPVRQYAVFSAFAHFFLMVFFTFVLIY